MRWAVVGVVSVVVGAAMAPRAWQSTEHSTLRPLRAADLTRRDVLASLPDGPAKRQFILDCTGCHQMDLGRAFPDGHARSDSTWRAVVQRMLSFAGATTGFPVIGSSREPVATAAWLRQYLTAPAAIGTHRLVGDAERDSAEVREFPLDEPADLPHDIAVDSGGRIVVTGMMTHQMLVLDTASGRWTSVPIPVPQANPRAVEVDRAGRWWIALGKPHKVARYSPADGPSSWRVFDAEMYAHSIALTRDGNAWVNGHFTRNPELIAVVDSARESVRTVSLPPHPTLQTDPAGPIPYELRVAPNGVIWTSELSGNRLVGYDPATRTTQVITMPEPHMGPRRFDIDRQGVLWIPAYASNALVRIDPSQSGDARTTRFPLPVSNMLPYVVRMAPGDSALWIGTGAGGGILRFDTRTARFTYFALPSSGALIRHLTIDPRTRDVWLAYGASPGIPARVARLRTLR